MFLHKHVRWVIWCPWHIKYVWCYLQFSKKVQTTILYMCKTFMEHEYERKSIIHTGQQLHFDLKEAFPIWRNKHSSIHNKHFYLYQLCPDLQMLQRCGSMNTSGWLRFNIWWPLWSNICVRKACKYVTHLQVFIMSSNCAKSCKFNKSNQLTNLQTLHKQHQSILINQYIARDSRDK